MPNDEEILQAIKSDAQAGFAMLLRRYREPLYWHVRRMVACHDDAQDATQEAFIRAYRAMPQFRGECSLRAWLYRIATREALRIIERNGRRVQLAIDDLAERDQRLAREDDTLDLTDLATVQMQRAILQLPERQRAAFGMRYYDEMPFAEIAQAMQCTVAAAKVNYHLAKQKVVKYLKSAM